MISFQTNPAVYQHWALAFEGPVARLRMGVKEDGGLVPGYELKLNSYDLRGQRVSGQRVSSRLGAGKGSVLAL